MAPPSRLVRSPRRTRGPWGANVAATSAADHAVDARLPRPERYVDRGRRARANSRARARRRPTRTSSPAAARSGFTVGREVRHDQQPGPLVLADERIDLVVLGQQHPERAVHDGRLLVPQRDQPSVVAEHGVRVVDLRGGIDLGVVGVGRDPRLAVGEAGVRASRPTASGCGRCRGSCGAAPPSPRRVPPPPPPRPGSGSATRGRGSRRRSRTRCWSCRARRPGRRTACRGAGAGRSPAPWPTAPGGPSGRCRTGSPSAAGRGYRDRGCSSRPRRARPATGPATP